MTVKKELDVKPDNLLLENSMSIFHLLIPLVSGDRGANTGQDLRAKLLDAFEGFEKSSYEMRLESSAISDVKYAIAAFADETVMSSAWTHKLSWMGKPLQLEFFGDNLAGEGFYQRLSKLRQSGDRNINVIEIYYLCMQLGFEGMYRMKGLEQLQALHVDLRTQIFDTRSRVPRTLSPHGVAEGSFIEKVQRNLPYWVIALAMVLVIFFSYVLFAVLLGYKADTVRDVLQNDGRHIQASLDRDGSRKVAVKFVPVVEEVPRKEVPPPPKPEIVKEEPPKKRKHKQPETVVTQKPVAPVTPEVKQEVKAEVKPVPKPEAKPELKPEVKPEVKPKVAPPILGF